MKRPVFLLSLMLLGALVVAACATATPEPAPTQPPPDVEEPSGLPDLGGRKVSIAIENAYLPFNFILLETGEADGWDYDFINEACERLNCEPVWQEFAWDTMIAAVADDQFDMAADGITITEERAQSVAFTDGYINLEQRLLVLDDEDHHESLEELAADPDAILSQQIGTTNYAVAEAAVGADRIQTFDDFGQAVQAVVSGDTDGTIVDETAGQGYLGANKDLLKLVGPSLSSDQLGFIFPLGSDLVDPFNQVIAEMKADGFLEQLNKKWFGPDFVTTYDEIGDGAYATPDLGTAENPIVWVLIPSQETETVLAGADDIAAAIEEGSGLIVNPVITTDFTSAVEAMCSDEAQMGALNTFNYILASARGCAEVGVASVRFGSTFYNGQIVTQADSGITSIADLAGKTFCRPDPTSTSGWVVPNIAMQAEGIDPENDLAEIVDAGGHDGVIIAVYNGDCDAGSTFVDARGIVEDEFPDVNDVVVVIAESAPIPNDNISFATGVPASVRDAIIGVLLDMASNDEGLAILDSVYSWSGMQVVDDSFYDGFRQTLDAAGVNIEDLAG